MEFPVTVESQEAFDTMVKDRLAREKTRQDELQAQVTALTAEKETLTKAASGQEAAIEAAKKEAADAAKAEVTDSVAKVLRAAEVRALAAELHFNDPADALAALGDLSDVTVGEDFTIEADPIKARLSEIAEKKPYLIAKAEDFTFENEGGLGKKGNQDPLAGKSGTDLMASAFDAKTNK